jgi:multidrug efflux pump subunit AcrA (membrane-fusion protein)
MKKFILPAVAAVALILGLGSVVQSQPWREATLPPSGPPESPFARTVAAVGLVETSTENIAVGTPLSDVVAEVHVAAGQTVRCGAPLFTLDVRHWRADLEAARAALRVAESQVQVQASVAKDLRSHLAFAEALSDPRAISQEELSRRRFSAETAEARLAEAKAQMTVAAASVRRTEVQIDRSTVRAPIDGLVLQVKVHPGEFAPAGTTPIPLVLLGRLKPLHVRVDVDEHEAWRVRPEARASAAVRGNPQLRAPLAFVRFEPFVLPKKSLTGDSTERVDTRVLEVIYRVEDGAIPLFVGQQVDVFIEGAE